VFRPSCSCCALARRRRSGRPAYLTPSKPAAALAQACGAWLASPSRDPLLPTRLETCPTVCPGQGNSPIVHAHSTATKPDPRLPRSSRRRWNRLRRPRGLPFDFLTPPSKEVRQAWLPIHDSSLTSRQSGNRPVRRPEQSASANRLTLTPTNRIASA